MVPLPVSSTVTSSDEGFECKSVESLEILIDGAGGGGWILRLVLGLGLGRGLGRGVNWRPLKEESTLRWRSKEEAMSGTAAYWSDDMISS